MTCFIEPKHFGNPVKIDSNQYCFKSSLYSMTSSRQTEFMIKMSKGSSVCHKVKMHINSLKKFFCFGQQRLDKAFLHDILQSFGKIVHSFDGNMAQLCCQLIWQDSNLYFREALSRFQKCRWEKSNLSAFCFSCWRNVLEFFKISVIRCC